RTPPNIFLQGGNLSTQYDCGRLQSMAEARDMLVGTGVTSAELAGIDAKISNGAQAFLGDVTLSFRANNLGIKAGAALVTVGLALRGDARASGWLREGTRLVNLGLNAMAGTEGFFKEGPSYLNYTFNNLLPAAWHVRKVTGIDWWASLRPLIETGLSIQLPSGQQPAFEDALPSVYPWHLIAPAYQGQPLAGECMWAWERGDKNTSNFDNQQFTPVTAFVLTEPSIVPTAPAGDPTTFVGPDGHVLSLRSGFDSLAVQASLCTAIDYSNLTLITSRHNQPNPLELIMSGHGQELLVAGTGGPRVTLSQRRAYYLSPSAKNVILINQDAPFVTEPSRVKTDARLSSYGLAGGAPLISMGRTEIPGYGGADRVRRTLGLVGGSYALVLDEIFATNAVPLSLPFRGRGSRQVITNTPSEAAVTWTYNGAALDLFSSSSVDLTLTAATDFYAPSFGQEENIEGIRLTASPRTDRVLTVLQPRPQTAAPLFARRLATGPGVVALAISDGSGAEDIVVCGPEGQGGQAQGLATNGTLGIQRMRNGLFEGAAMVQGTSLSVFGAPLLEATQPATIALAITTSGAELSIAKDQGQLDVAVFGLDPARAYEASLSGFAIDASRVTSQGGVVRVTGLPSGGGMLVLREGTGSSTGGTGGGSTGTGTTTTSSSGGGGGGGCRHEGTPAPLGLLLVLLALVGVAGRWRRLG
ncbi:MAG: hypothetical protein ACYS22_13885, partial [Planctomycetota bacterium]